MLIIFVGVWAEQMAVERLLEVLERRELGGYPVSVGSRYGKAVVVCRTGPGERRGEGAANALFSEYAPGAVVSARLSGSVSDDVRAGDLVLCENLYLFRCAEPTDDPPIESNRRLLALGQHAAREAGLRYTLNSALTAATPGPQTLDRELISSKYSVAVVDTDGHTLAEAAKARGVPFLAVRAALGRSFDPVPESLGFVAERGIIRPWRAVAHYLRRPGKAPAFLRLGMSVRKASLHLSAFTDQFLREWSLEP